MDGNDVSYDEIKPGCPFEQNRVFLYVKTAGL